MPILGADARRLACAAAAALVLLSQASLADGPDLLENNRAFAFSARGADAQTIEARFAVAPGYYLYRDKLRFTVEGAQLKGVPALPPGTVKEDEFFGKTQTYRGVITVRLPLAKPAAGSSLHLVAESQGCADIGVCYPPQRQEVDIPMPEANARAAAFVEAAPSRRSWFR
ncbi:MAG: hypothetical protein M3Z31_19105 [Pseudomonadota bacterium]|nr:hypothetical protein [Pseudomonadota bacterium]